MLYETFNSLKEAHGEDYFTSRLDEEVIQNLNPKLNLREYQKEAAGRFDFYCSEYRQRKYPSQLLFLMATGSGKTLVMATNILQLYKKGYRNFIFFVNSVNIIEKTKNNFLNPLSEKYLFAPKIEFGGKEIFIKEVPNFETASPEDINIHFTTIQGLHVRLNSPKENALTYDDLANKEIVLISDEAHHLQAITKKGEKETLLERSWENTVENIFNKNNENILLEFTATIDLSNSNIFKKYQDKIIFRYDLKQFRLDKYSKEINVLQADLQPMDRSLHAVVLSQYRRKIAEKNKIHLKPIILFKSKSIKESKENYEKFLEKVKNVSPKDIQEIRLQAQNTELEKAFIYFQKENISFENLITELQEDFSEEKVMLLDSENIDEEKQLKLNSLENRNNEIRAIFAVNMLNEGWDVLNLFDIVRLYDTRDGKWVGGMYKPGNTTIGEAQLIGRGARYFPFYLEGNEDDENKYKRKFDDDIENEMRILETLHYHSGHKPEYITEIKSTLREIGIMAEKNIQVDLFIKPEFKKTNFWENGIIFLNERMANPRTDILSLADAKIPPRYEYKFRTYEISEEIFLSENNVAKVSKIETSRVKYKLPDFGENIIRCALDRLEFYKFETLKKYFPHLDSIKEFITSNNYLGNIKVDVSGPKDKLNKLTQNEKLEIALFVTKSIAEKARVSTSEYIGSKYFTGKQLRGIFKNKKINIDIDELKSKELRGVNLGEKDWYAQNEFYGTEEEQNFIKFLDGFIEKLRQKYSDIALLRNERFFQIFDFDQGRPFEPDFLLLLKEQNKDNTCIYQIFIEPKGDQFKDSKGRFENSKEGWKQKFLLELEHKAKTYLRFKNKHFKIVGLPFYNEKLKQEFEDALERKTLV